MEFSEEIIDYLGVLYRHERHNSYVYSKISNFLNVEGFKKLSKYYEEWSNHEMEHSILVRNFCNSNNIIIDMSKPIDGLDINLEILPITHFSIVTVDVENETTDLYNDLLKMGHEIDNGFIKKFAYSFLEEQQEETDKALTLYDSIKNIGDNRSLLQLFDNTFEG